MPLPDPIWLFEPYQGPHPGNRMVTMDASIPEGVGPVEYYFEETTGGSGGMVAGGPLWQTSNRYFVSAISSGLQSGTYSYRFKYRDSGFNESDWSATVSIFVYNIIRDESIPIAWSTPPYISGATSIRMVAQTIDPDDADHGSGSSTPLYNFRIFKLSGSGNLPRFESGFLTSPDYEFTDLPAGGVYLIWFYGGYTSTGTILYDNWAAFGSTVILSDEPEDTDPPVPNPSTWLIEPYATSSTTISMTATTATDPSGVEYYFDEISGNPGATDSGWQDSSSYTDSGLSADTTYTYRVKTRDKSPNQNEGEYSTQESATTPTIAAEDTDPPIPNPSTWSIAPYSSGETSIGMVATTATDPSGVEYYFDETTGGSGATDSGWQDSPIYEDTGLSPATLYTYRVRTRDKSPNQNEGGWSADGSATTDAQSDNSPPVPNPSTWFVEPYATGPNSINMVATTATDPSGVEYYFDETTGNVGGSDSGWQDSPSYEDTGLLPETTYTYRVKTRDKSYSQNEGSYSTSESATTDAESGSSVCDNVAMPDADESPGGGNLGDASTESIDPKSEESPGINRVGFADEYCLFDNEYLDEYAAIHGGKWYYAQNKPGTKWFDLVDNEKGWTLDFNLRVFNVENSYSLSDTDEPSALGIYFNDGSYQEKVYFLEQEIVFANVKQTIRYDTTSATHYRFTCKGNELKLFAREDNGLEYSRIAQIPFNTDSTNEANGYKPATYEDSNGDLHIVWHDDGNTLGQIYYSKYDGSEWSSPELVVSGSPGSQRPDIIVDGNSGDIYVVYETKESDHTTVAFVTRTSFGWSQPTFIGVGIHESHRPRLSFDSENDVHVIWEDHRFGHPEIFHNEFVQSSQSWAGEQRLTTTSYGASLPVIDSYFDTLFISFVMLEVNNRKKIQLVSYNSRTNNLESIVDVSSDYHQASYPDILVTSGGSIFILWQDNQIYDFELYGRIFNVSLSPLIDQTRITATLNDSLYVSLTEQRSTGDVYFAWEDYRDGAYDDPYVDEYRRVRNPQIYVAYYENLTGTFHSSGQGEFDVRLVPSDERESYAPAIPRSFSGDLHVIYETLISRDEEIVLNTPDVFRQIRDAIYDLTYEEDFLLYDTYIDRDLLTSNRLLRKELRFGDFSDTMSCKFTFKYIRYYLNDAVGPFEVAPICGETYAIDDFRVTDAVVNEHGDSWFTSLCGLWFYSGIDERLVKVDDDAFSAIVFDKNNTLFIATHDVSASDIYYSFDHSTLVKSGINNLGPVTSLAIDKQNRLIIGTLYAGVFIYSYVESGGFITETLERTLNEELPSLGINTVTVDDANVIWIATDNGLARYANNAVLVFNTNTGLSSNFINDIAIRNTGIRYIATANGIDKMVGSGIEKMSSDTGDIWNNNVKAIEWRNPNILWATTLSRINQVMIDETESINTNLFQPEYYTSDETELDEKKVFFIVTTGSDEIPSDAEIEVYLNGNQITYGFDISKGPTDFYVIKFLTDLLSTDVVDVIVRNDLRLLTSFKQSNKEKFALGLNTIRISDIQTHGSNVYISTNGDEKQVKLNDRATSFPFDSIHLDQTPPSGCLSIVEQIDINTVRVAISDATDGIDGSGLDRMILSSFSNFTTNGTTAKDSVLFSTSAIHNFNEVNVGTSTPFDIDSTGTTIQYFPSDGSIYAGSSKPGELYKFNKADNEWLLKVTYGSDRYLDMIAYYNNKILIGLGRDAGNAELYIYDDDGTFLSYTTLAVDGNRIYSSVNLNGTLYIGTGQNGKLYKFDGSVLTEVFSELGSNIYDLTVASNVIFAATGETGLVYRIDPDNDVAMISHSDSDTAITAIGAAPFGGKTWIFAGTVSQGKILRSDPSNASFNKSFQTIASKATTVKTFGTILYISIGTYVYYLSTGGTWVWFYTHGEQINKMAFDPIANRVYVISDSNITTIDPPEQTKTVYLKLIDKATNETSLYNSSGTMVACYFNSISLSDLQGIVSQNRLIELDSDGNVVFSMAGEDNFYSGKRIDYEEGIYDSEIFNGTNDLIQWDRISWQATEPENTDVFIYVRANDSRTDILLEEWTGPFTLTQSAGVDISYVSGQFIQFRAVLRSEQKGISPSLRNVLIRLISGEAVHFFTTNFVLPSRMTKGILTSQKFVPVSADIVFGINTTNSVDWTEYQIIDENRLFDVTQFGENMRVGIRFITPDRSALLPTDFDEYGPYGTDIFINTIDFVFTNTGPAGEFNFRITLYEDINMTIPVFEAFSSTDQDNFSADSEAFPADGKEVASNASTRILYTVPGYANINCDTYYFVKIESYDNTSFDTLSDDHSFISGCSASFVDIIDFEFRNESTTANFHFRIQFYSNAERTNLYRTEFSGNNREGWTSNSADIPEGGVEIVNGATANISFEPDLSDFSSNTLYYITIDTYNGNVFELSSNSYTFQAHDASSLIYCGPYFDVPIVYNFGLMFEMLGNELLTLNLGQ